MPKPTLRGARLVLVPQTIGQARALLAGATDRLEGLELGPGYPHADTLDGLRMWVEHGGSDDGGWFVTLADDGRVVGDCGTLGQPDEHGRVSARSPPRSRSGTRRRGDCSSAWASGSPGRSTGCGASSGPRDRGEHDRPRGRARVDQLEMTSPGQLVQHDGVAVVRRPSRVRPAELHRHRLVTSAVGTPMGSRRTGLAAS